MRLIIYGQSNFNDRSSWSKAWTYETKKSLAKGTINHPKAPTVPQAQIMKSILNTVTKRSD